MAVNPNLPAASMNLTTFGPARSTGGGAPLAADELRRLHAFWRACNYLALGMIYLQDNPLLREPLKPEHLKNRLLGHWGASPALAFVYTHLNRAIKHYDLNAIFLAGPGHGAPGVLGPVYLEGTYSEIYPDKSLDAEGLKAFGSSPFQVASAKNPGGLVKKLQTGRTARQAQRAGTGPPRPGAGRPPPHGCQPKRQKRENSWL